MRNSLDTGWWDNRSAQWDKIKVPFYSAGNWSGHNLHLRGNTEGYTQAASRHKKLRIHTGTHYHAFYTEEGRRDQLRWFDHWLKGIDTGIMDEPPVKLMIRTGGGGMKDYKFRFENEWPLKRTRWTRLYLNAEKKLPTMDEMGREGALLRKAPARAARSRIPRRACRMPAFASASSTMLQAGSMHRTGVSFETAPLTADTEVTGPVKLVLWVSSTVKDMDMFVTLRNIGADGKDVWEVGQQGQKVPVAKGWLRASHRKLDAKSRCRTGRTMRTTNAGGSSPASPSNAKSKSGRPAWCSGKDTASGSTSSRATAPAARRILIIRRPTTRVVRIPCTRAASMASYLMLPIIPEKA